ncbi:hypothetical protein [Comamonas kerstersii]|uniref:Uncharacterized protein n=1 Tax=Comamonas kerstersii TaxID=225992 RepID=A0A6A1R1K1_9BURK|nr:hypothetical protein [Comamonas kerstersii]KAB0586188.1 hypothetical protein F7P80_11175 [Comamonas kerstersii]
MTDKANLTGSHEFKIGETTYIRTNVKTDYELTMGDGTKIHITVLPGQMFGITPSEHSTGPIDIAIVNAEFGRGPDGLTLVKND